MKKEVSMLKMKLVGKYQLQGDKHLLWDTAIQSKELQPTECRYLIQPKEEDNSTNKKDAVANQKYFVK